MKENNETDKKNCKVASQVTHNGIKYEFELAGKSGAIYYLLPAPGTSKKEIEEAKVYIRNNFDAIKITVESGIYKKKKGDID